MEGLNPFKTFLMWIRKTYFSLCGLEKPISKTKEQSLGEAASSPVAVCALHPEGELIMSGKVRVEPSCSQVRAGEGGDPRQQGVESSSWRAGWETFLRHFCRHLIQTLQEVRTSWRQ